MQSNSYRWKQNNPNVFSINYVFNHVIFQVSTEILTFFHFVITYPLLPWQDLSFLILKFYPSGFTGDFQWPQLLLQTCSCHIFSDETTLELFQHTTI